MKKVICNEKRKPEVFSNVKKVTNCKQLKGEEVERWKGEKIANALALLSHIVAAASFHPFTFSPFYFYLGR